MKKMIMIIMYENIARIDGFWRAPEIDFLYETKARKMMVDFKFDALYKISSPAINVTDGYIYHPVLIVYW